MAERSATQLQQYRLTSHYRSILSMIWGRRAYAHRQDSKVLVPGKSKDTYCTDYGGMDARAQVDGPVRRMSISRRSVKATIGARGEGGARRCEALSERWRPEKRGSQLAMVVGNANERRRARGGEGKDRKVSLRWCSQLTSLYRILLQLNVPQQLRYRRQEEGICLQKRVKDGLECNVGTCGKALTRLDSVSSVHLRPSGDARLSQHLRADADERRR